MTKQELIEKVYETKGLPRELTKKTVTTILDSAFAQLGDYFIKEKMTRSHTPRFTYPGFGTFAKRRRPEREGRHPQTGQPIIIPAQTTITFTPGQDMKAYLNRKK